MTGLPATIHYGSISSVYLRNQWRRRRSALPTDAPILSLPGKEIQQRRQRLSHETKRDPENTIAQNLAVNSLHLLQRQRHGDQGDLHHHANESNPEDIMRGHTNQQFVQHAAKDKHRHTCRAGAPTAADERVVDVPSHEVVDGLVPGAPVRADGGRIPPFGVEFPIAEAHDLREAVERGLEDGEEAG